MTDKSTLATDKAVLFSPYHKRIMELLDTHTIIATLATLKEEFDFPYDEAALTDYIYRYTNIKEIRKKAMTFDFNKARQEDGLQSNIQPDDPFPASG